MTLPIFLTDGNGNKVNFVNGALPTASVAGTSITPGATVVETALDSGSVDAFGRLRVSNTSTLLGVKLVNHAHTGIWDDSETSGAGTTSTYNSTRSDVRMLTTASTAGTRVRQTFRHFNYSPAKSQLIFCTFSDMGSSAGITKRVGYFEGSDGLFYESATGVNSFVVRSSVSGGVVDTASAQATWNIDKLDGTGTSGFTLDPDKANILVIDFEWLGVGRVRFGFVIDGKLIYCHAVNNANSVTSVYMKSPALPVRYELTNNGSGVADLGMYAICASVSNEGEQDKVGVPAAGGHDSTITLSGTLNTWAAYGLRLKSDHLHADIQLTGIQGYATSSDGVLVTVLVNPTINGALTWSAVGDTSLEEFTGNGAALDITDNGRVAYKFAIYGKTDNKAISLGDLPLLGSFIDGTPTTLVIGVKALTANPKFAAFVNWREP